MALCVSKRMESELQRARVEKREKVGGIWFYM